MARAWRIEFEGALYHVLSRGNERQDIVATDEDRKLFLNTLGEMGERFEVDIFAYVLMDNHYHLLFRTNRANLCRSMQWFGATYTKRFNLRHGIFIGTVKFVKKIKKRYLPDTPHTELPHQKQVTRSVNLGRVLSKAADILKCDIEHCRNSARISH